MIMLPVMLVDAAAAAGMKVPKDPDNFDPSDFPHFAVYCNAQLGVPVTWGNHWRNAEIIAKIPKQKIRKMTMQDLADLGFSP